MAANGERIVRWIRQELEKTPAAARFQLWLQDSHGQKEKVGQYEVPGHISDLKLTSEELGNDCVMASANDVARGMEGKVHFTLMALIKIKGDTDSKKWRYPIRNSTKLMLRGLAASEDPHLIMDSETPDKKGQVAQNMRHIERLMDMNHSMMAALTEGVREENNSLRQRARETEAQVAEARKRSEELMDKSFERQMMLNTAAADRERKDVLIKKAAEEFLPQLAQRVPDILKALGIGDIKPGAPAALPPAVALQNEVRDIFSSLPPAERFSLLGKMPEVHRDNFFALLSDNAAREIGEVTAILRGALKSIPEEEMISTIEKLPQGHQAKIMGLLGV